MYTFQGSKQREQEQRERWWSGKVGRRVCLLPSLERISWSRDSPRIPSETPPSLREALLLLLSETSFSDQVEWNQKSQRRRRERSVCLFFFFFLNCLLWPISWNDKTEIRLSCAGSSREMRTTYRSTSDCRNGRLFLPENVYNN